MWYGNSAAERQADSRSPDHVLDVELLSLARVERTNVLIDFGTKGAQFFDMRQ
jgi:hypothetical protein